MDLKTLSAASSLGNLFLSMSFLFNIDSKPFSMIQVVFAGGFVGMLINYFADVLPLTRSFSHPCCRECKQPSKLKRYLFLGNCPNCGTKPSIRSIIVIIAAIVGCLLIKIFPFSVLGFWETLPLLVFLGMIMVIDIEHRVVLIQTSIFGFFLFLVYGLVLNGLSKTMVGALGGFLVMLFFYFLGMAFTRILGKIRQREIDEVAFGFGDVCAGTLFGLLAGWPSIIGAIIVAMLSYGVISFFWLIALLALKKYQAFSNTQPFTLFLILGLISIFYL